ncbi:hypothetical protein PPERSA_03648 [Pseudocohnilembus persalinus]|uniref:Uncharacterized protein n=1 Tax=Pseudocohnilembus persalinus TaxID=266149 RepID=A0A0V0R7Y1_PSEPJ|nr:hypothetical protein PPERSA_03648 [Pseudocohnilembus persalinus]|eukprot:KRX10341.1 hypothetical protein PPERSA_03648 [Pseudocohnilembus persalinus]
MELKDDIYQLDEHKVNLNNSPKPQNQLGINLNPCSDEILSEYIEFSDKPSFWSSLDNFQNEQFENQYNNEKDQLQQKEDDEESNFYFSRQIQEEDIEEYQENDYYNDYDDDVSIYSDNYEGHYNMNLFKARL